MCSPNGGESVMRGRTCCSQQLKALALNLSRMYCLSCGRFSSVGAHGREGGDDGGRDLVGHLHGGSPGLTTPEFEHLGRLKTAQCTAHSFSMSMYCADSIGAASTSSSTSPT